MIRVMKPFRWAPDKNDALKATRAISFEEVVIAIDGGGLVDIVAHPNPSRYPNQRIMVVDVLGYLYLVPYIEERDYLILKTVIPSRKATRTYLRRKDRND